MGTTLLIMIFLPAAAAVVVAMIGSHQPAFVRRVALAATVATFVLSVVLAITFEPRPEPPAIGSPGSSTAGPIQLDPQTVVKTPWLPLDKGTGQAPVIQFYLGLDGISLWLVCLTTLLMVPSVLVSWEAITDRVAEYYALLLALETGMLGVFCSFDIILFYIFFEFTLVPLFFLIGIWGGPQKRYAARKFFIFTLAGSLIGLVGLVGLVLAVHQYDDHTFTFSIPELAQKAGGLLPYDTQVWIFLALFIGFAVKVPLVPFHTWLPLAHTEAPTAGSVLLAGVLLKLGTYGFLRLCLPLVPAACLHVGVPLIGTLSVIGILYGALCSLAQSDIKKLVAYSSISHLGFCMLGLFALNTEGITGGVLQMINHGLSTGALFLLVGMLYERYHTRELNDLGGLAAKVPMLACFMVFISLSSLGLPGLNGFVGEVLSIIGMFKVQPAYAVFGAIGIVLGAWYLLNVLRTVFFGPVKEPHGLHGPVPDLKPREWAALAPIAVMCIWIGVYPETFIRPMEPDVRAIEQVYKKR